MVRKFPLKSKKIGYQRLALLRKNALGMELHALHWQPLVAEAHDHGSSIAILSAGGDFQLLGQAFFLDDERMVARGGHRRRQAAENRTAVMHDAAGLAMHQVLRANHLAAECGTYRLMSQANSEDGHFSCSLADQLNTDSRLA